MFLIFGYFLKFLHEEKTGHSQEFGKFTSTDGKSSCLFCPECFELFYANDRRLFPFYLKDKEIQKTFQRMQERKKNEKLSSSKS